MGAEPCVRFDEFLLDHELHALRAWALEREPAFAHGQVIGDDGRAAHVDASRRRSLVLMERGPVDLVVERRVRALAPWILRRLGVEPFPVGLVETQLTASRDGDFFALHRDNHSAQHEGRTITGVLFFGLEPRRFTGGELELLPGDGDDAERVVVAPRANTAVFFPSHLAHRVTPVRSDDDAFSASRFSMTVWLTPAPTGRRRRTPRATGTGRAPAPAA